jgi:tripartite-type tricarboxylate transporter receptor subunit TctC
VATGGVGTSQHINAEFFKMLTGTEMTIVHYRGGILALSDLIGGRVQAMFDTFPSSIEQIKAGKLRALAVTSGRRSHALPEIPTVGDSLVGYEATGLHGIGAPQNTPKEIIERLNREINAALADPKIRARLSDLGAEIITGLPGDFGKLIAAETEKWAKVIRAAGIKAD